MHTSDQISIRYFDLSPGGGLALPPRSLELYTTFFVEDIGSSVWPFSYRTRTSQNVTVELKSDNKFAETIIAAALSRDSYYQELEAAVGDFISAAAQQIAEFDFAIAEIVTIRRADTDAPNVQFVWVNPHQIRRKWRRTYQIVPFQVAVERGVKKRILLPKEKIIEFTAPPQWRKAISTTRKALQAISDLRNQSFPMTALESKIPFDWSAHESAMMLALAEAGRPIAFGSRGMFNKYVATPCWIRLRLLHELFLIDLRNTLLNTLNDGLKRVGANLGFNCELIVRGLPKKREIEIALNQLTSGSLPLTKLMDAYS